MRTNLRHRLQGTISRALSKELWGTLQNGILGEVIEPTPQMYLVHLAQQLQLRVACRKLLRQLQATCKQLQLLCVDNQLNSTYHSTLIYQVHNRIIMKPLQDCHMQIDPQTSETAQLEKSHTQLLIPLTTTIRPRVYSPATPRGYVKSMKQLIINPSLYILLAPPRCHLHAQLSLFVASRSRLQSKLLSVKIVRRNPSSLDQGQEQHQLLLSQPRLRSFSSPCITKHKSKSKVIAIPTILPSRIALSKMVSKASQRTLSSLVPPSLSAKDS